MFFFLRYLLCFTLLILVACDKSSNIDSSKNNLEKADQILSKITPKDRIKIEAFLEILTKEFDFAYTFFGDKPCSLACYWSPFNQSLDNTFTATLILNQGWKVWSQYRHLLAKDKFIIRHIGSESNKCNLSTVFLINIQATLKTLKQHLALFQRNLDIDLTADEILVKMSEDDAFLSKCLDSDMLGLLLGYGAKNSIGFNRRNDLSININRQSLPPLESHFEQLEGRAKFFVKALSKSKFPSKKGSEVPSPGFINLIEELNSLTKMHLTFELRGSNYFLEEFQSPVFAVFENDAETEGLYLKYEEIREKVIQAYHGKSFAEVSLNQF